MLQSVAEPGRDREHLGPCVEEALEATDNGGRINEGFAGRNVYVTFLGVVIKYLMRSNQRTSLFSLMLQGFILSWQGSCGCRDSSQLWPQEQEAAVYIPHGSGNRTGSGVET